jgi:NAD(P)-dependent dehydrogenase (short-subunit alcohol dehydrogenase family)
VPRILADGHQIRILVNCAGIQRRHPCEKFPDSDFNQVSQTPHPRFMNSLLPPSNNN